MKNTILFGLMVVSATALAAPDHGGHGDHDQGVAIGEPGDPAAVARTIEVRMTDTMRFAPERIAVRPGEVIRFVVVNDGVLPHEFVIDTMEGLLAHAGEMRAGAAHAHGDEGPTNKVYAEGGESGELVWRFTAKGDIDFACLVPGHFEAGMQGVITVE